MRWCLLCLLLMGPAWVSSMDRTPLPDAAERSLVYPGGTHVLIIGISNYRNEAWPALHAGRDVQRIQALFIDRGVSPMAITVATPAAGDKTGLDEALVRFGEALPGDPASAARVVVYIAGHGYTRDGVGYLVPPDAPDPELHPAEFKLAALPITTILTRVAGYHSAHVLLMLDSCFSGLALQSLPRERFPHPVADRAHVLQVVTAGTAGQTVADDGRFSQLVTSGLLGAADLNLDGWVSGTELGMYLRLRISEVTGGRQTPTFGNIVWGSELAQGENWFASAQLPVQARETPSGDGSVETATFRDCDECPQMRIVPASSGATAAQPAAPYLAMGIHEITFDEYDACFRAGGCTHWAHSLTSGRGALPVIDVSRPDAEQYTRWLSCSTAGTYRLPRDPEWLAAAQPDAARLGSQSADVPANCRDCATGSPSTGPTPAGAFRANEYGLFDLVGNVWEWVADCHSASPGCGLVRGGAYSTLRKVAATLPAGELSATLRDRNIGFRVVRELTRNRVASSGSCAVEDKSAR